jgi:hypothetical protein
MLTPPSRDGIEVSSMTFGTRPADSQAYVRRVGGQRFSEWTYSPLLKLGARTDELGEHEIVQRREMGNKPATTYGYLESEEGVVRQSKPPRPDRMD